MQNPVLSKANFVRRYAAGEFGNCSPTWNTFEEFEDYLNKRGGYAEVIALPEKFHLRNRVAGGVTHYDKPAYTVYVLWSYQYVKGEGNNWYCSMMAPTSSTVFQGEIERTHKGLALYYSTVRKPMRDSLREGGKQVYGVSANTLVRDLMPERDREWLMHLLDEYPDHVVEFSTYSKQFGTVPGFRTCYWEVRKY